MGSLLLRFLSASLLSAFLCGIPLLGQPTTRLDEDTRAGFDKYVSSMEAEYLDSFLNKNESLWLEGPRDAARIRSGDILIQKAQEVPSLPGGLIHDWTGAIFIPQTNLQDVVDLLTDYDRHQDLYTEVVESKLLEKSGAKFRSFLRFEKVKVLTVVLNTEHEAELFDAGEGRKFLLSRSLRIAEVKNPGTPKETELPVGEDSGFLWRLNAYWLLEQHDDGVLVACSSISLSRSIPWGLSWIIKPFVESTPKEALEETLGATRLALSKGLDGKD